MTTTPVTSYSPTAATLPAVSWQYEEEYTLPEGTDSSPSHNSSNQSSGNPVSRSVLGGAAVAGGVVGMILVGPIVGLAAAGGAAALATTKGKAGDLTRATGEVVASAGSRLKKIDQKHHITSKTASGIVKSANWVSKKMKPKS